MAALMNTRAKVNSFSKLESESFRRDSSFKDVLRSTLNGSRWQLSTIVSYLLLELKTAPTVSQVVDDFAKSNHTCCVLIDDKSHVKGLITSSDIVDNVVCKRLEPKHVLCSSIMQRNFLTIVEGSDRSSLGKGALEIMIRSDQWYLPVVDSHGNFADLLDVVKIAGRFYDQIAYSKRSRKMVSFGSLSELIPRKHSSLALCAIPSTNTLSAAPCVMVESEFSDVQVVDAGRTLHDIARLMHTKTLAILLVECSNKKIFVITDESIVQCMGIGYNPSTTTFNDVLLVIGKQPVVFSAPSSKGDHVYSECVESMCLHNQKVAFIVDSAAVLGSGTTNGYRYQAISFLAALRGEWVQSGGRIADQLLEAPLAGTISAVQSSVIPDVHHAVPSRTAATQAENQVNKISRLQKLVRLFACFRSNYIPLDGSQPGQNVEQQRPHVIRLPSGKIATLPLSSDFDDLPPLPSASSKRLIEKTNACIADQDFSQAIRLMTQYLGKNSWDGRVLLKRGKVYRDEMRNNEEALHDFLAALRTHHLGEHDRQECLFWSCICFLETAQYLEVERFWDQNLLSQEEATVTRILEECLVMLKNVVSQAQAALKPPGKEYERALQICNSAVRLVEFIVMKQIPAFNSILMQDHSPALMVYSIRGLCKQRLGLLDSALGDFRACLDLCPVNYDEEEEKQSGRQYKSQFDDCMQAQELRTAVANLSNRIDEAISDSTSDMEEADDGNDDTAQVCAEQYVLRARLFVRQGCYVRASKDYRHALKICPRVLRSSLEDESRIILVMREGEDFQEILNTYCENSMYEGIHRMMHFIGQSEQPLKDYIRRFLEERLHHLLRMGMASLSSMQFEQAMHQFSSAIQICEQFIDVLQNNQGKCETLYLNRALCLMKFREYNSAIMDCDTVLIMDQMNEKAWIRKCHCYEGIEDSEGFFKTATEAKRLFGNTNQVISQLFVKAISTLPAEAADSVVVTSDELNF